MQVVRERPPPTKLLQIINTQRQVVNDPQEIANLSRNYYQTLYIVVEQFLKVVDAQHVLLNLLPNRMTKAMKIELAYLYPLIISGMRALRWSRKKT